MIPFPGESVYIARAADGADFDLGLEVRNRGGYFTDVESRTLAAGDEWRAWVSPGAATYLDDPATDAVVSWVLEVLSGTVTLTAGEGYEPTGSDETALPTRTLGTYTVTGPATLVIPSEFTVPEVYSGAAHGFDSMMLHVSASSGSAVVQQVKMRVWPPGGPVGGWSDVKPSWSTTPGPPGFHTAVITASGEGITGDPESAWDAAIAAYHADVAALSATTPRTLTPTTSGAVSASAAQQLTIQSTAPTYRGLTSSQAWVVMVTGAATTGLAPIDQGTYTAGVDWIRPPNEVNGDVEHYGDPTGDPVTMWVDAYVTVSEAGDATGGPSLVSMGGEWAPDSANTWTLPVEHGAATGGTVPLDVAAGDRRIYVSLSHSLATGDGDEWPGWVPSGGFPEVQSDSYGMEFVTALGDPIRTYVLMPPYRMWSPTPVADALPKVRQIHRDDGRGMTPRRHFGGASRATTGRHFGYD